MPVPDCPPGWTRGADGVCQAPPPPPEETKQCPDGAVIPVAQECPNRAAFSDPFILFFDWDKDEITPAAAAILDNAAGGYRQLGPAPVVIAAHTDRSGSERYNDRLSQRRADNVRDYLAGRGIPRDAITVESFGERHPLVDTPDGVREPQNRRVEVTFGPGR
jgi:OmpA-OmpF porin, OOP family